MNYWNSHFNPYQRNLHENYRSAQDTLHCAVKQLLKESSWLTTVDTVHEDQYSSEYLFCPKTSNSHILLGICCKDDYKIEIKEYTQLKNHAKALKTRSFKPKLYARDSEEDNEQISELAEYIGLLCGKIMSQ